MKRLSKEEYLTRLKEIQPELQIVGEYKGANIKIRVKDRLGINYLCKPYNLLAGKVPNLSSAVNKTLAYNTRLNQVFSNLVVDNYEDGKTKVLVTDDFGIEYLVSPSHLLLGAYPTLQTAKDKTLAFKILSSKVHKDYYDYSESVYLGMNHKLKIICRLHGGFYQNPNNHLQGQGCRSCADAQMSSKGWAKEKWVEASKRLEHFSPKLYVLRLYNNSESFIKIGITFTSIHKRFVSKLPYDYEILTFIEGSAEFIFEEEKRLHNLLKGNKYIPKLRFGGMYECYIEPIVKTILKKEKLI